MGDADGDGDTDTTACDVLGDALTPATARDGVAVDEDVATDDGAMDALGLLDAPGAGDSDIVGVTESDTLDDAVGGAAGGEIVFDTDFDGVRYDVPVLEMVGVMVGERVAPTLCVTDGDDDRVGVGDGETAGF